jgi:hypothetical protein
VGAEAARLRRGARLFGAGCTVNITLTVPWTAGARFLPALQRHERVWPGQRPGWHLSCLLDPLPAHRCQLCSEEGPNPTGPVRSASW